VKQYALGLIVALALGSPASAATFSFDCIAGTSQSCGVGEATLSLNVANSGNGAVTLTFSNSDAGTSSLTAIYLDDSRLIASASNAGGAGTLFKSGGKPKDLPGGGTVSFRDDFRFTAKKRRATNGVEGGESLTIVLTLRSGVTFADVVSALGSGRLRIGANINDADPSCVGQNGGPRCVGDAGIASFVDLPSPVPEPVAALLGGVACLGLAHLGRRR
jgi:hypothetical protein